MIPLPAGVRVWLATGYTDMRKGFPSLALQVQEILHRDPLGGHLFCFRGRRGNLLKVIWHDEAWRLRKDGSVFWANVVIDPIHDEAGELVGFAKITRDITERRNAQLELQAAQRQRAHAQRMDALGQLTGGVAHDFNNLLMVVSGHIRTLQKAVADDTKLSRAANAISYAAERGAALTRQLLTFSRRQALN